MTLIGARLGPYEIQSALGAGGMGEVYRARDTRLDRTVAIKVLPSDVAADPERRVRFEREARAVAALSHPHICVVHDVGRDNGIDYLVMELLDGETLATRLDKGALPLDEALRVAIAVADGLTAAHRHGIVHRDLKPANIMLTKNGAKLLDFGLSKRAEPAVTLGGNSTHATAATDLTDRGTILGTLHYMSPEQVEGREADARSDIWALATVLYEMVTGARPFVGETPASVLSAILKDSPTAIRARQPMAPFALDRLVSAGLAKNPEDRWQDVRDMKRELQWLLTDRSSPASNGHVESRLSRARSIAVALAVAGVVLGAASVWWLRTPPSAALDPRRVLSLAPPEGIRITGSLAIAPDGRSIVFVGQGAEGAPSLWIRSFDTGLSRQLPNTDDPSYPFWSPDSDAVGFFANGKLKTVSLNAGGPPKVLATATSGRGGAWGQNAQILFTPETNSPILAVSTAGGEPHAVTTLDLSRGAFAHRWPSFVDNEHFLFTVQSTQSETAGLYLGSLRAPQTTRLAPQYSNGLYADGMLLHVNNGRVVASALDVAKGVVTAAAEVSGPVAFAMGLGHGVFSAVGSLLAYVPGPGESPASVLEWFDRSGRPLGRLASDSDLSKYNAYFQQISPRGGRVLVSAFTTTTADIWLVDVERGVASRSTFDDATEINPVWAPDGAQLAYATNRGGFYNMYRQSASSPGTERKIADAKSHQYPTDWSRDGGTIIYTNIDSKTQADIWAIPESGGAPTQITNGRFNEYAAHLSPNGNWLAYTSDESGRAEVYVQRFPGGGGKVPLSTQGGTEPVWRADGRELFYVGADRKVYVVPLAAGAGATGGATLTPGKATRVFDVPVDTSLGSMHGSHLAVSPDGQRFLISTSTINENALTAVVNWRQAVKAQPSRSAP